MDKKVLERLNGKMIQVQAGSINEARVSLEKALRLARRVEASKTVTGILSESLLSTIDNLLRIAVPLVSFSGDFELSALLSNLQIWLNKKRAEQAAEDARKQEMRGMGYQDLAFQYTY